MKVFALITNVYHYTLIYQQHHLTSWVRVL